MGSAWLILSVLFLLSRGATDQRSLLQTMVESSARLGSLLEQPAVSQQLLQRYGLDAPLFYVSWQPATGWYWHGFHNQYHTWLTQLLQGNLGTSYRSEEPVLVLLGQALQYTLPLTMLAATLSIALALYLVAATGYRPIVSNWVMSMAHTLQSIPLFLLALGLLLLLANPDALNWFPAFGLGPTGPTSTSWSHPQALLYQLTLPTLSLVLGSFPALAIQLNGSLHQELARPYVATARAKGTSQGRTIWRHALRNALLPTVTLLTELLPSIVAGSVVVEVIFALPGMGRLIADAAVQQDYPVLLAGVGLVAIVRLLAQLLADILYPLLDPRIRITA
ncbi:ABC transporter permease [Hymenobacter metallilatus]|uniref:ABC transporter permease n=1 Tax=Hymenobacter metallilatus TaxID=2493666 RepID=UPI00163A44E3|nr:ABC transporter permease [Hymenobacter metallilatus]